MPDPTTPTVRHDDDGQTIISGVTLILSRELHAGQRDGSRRTLGADALTALANGDTGAALGAALSSMLDMIAAGQPAVAAEALAISQELARRIVVTRAELRASL